MKPRVAKGYIGNWLKGNTMRKYTAKDEEDLIKEIESDPEIDKKWGPLIKGHVVEIKVRSRRQFRHEFVY
jgi:hypothetical protein